jgi:hypothetical protein
MRKTWIAVLTGALGVWSAGTYADDLPLPKPPVRTIPSGLPTSKVSEPPEKIKAPLPEGTATPAPAAPVAQPAPNGTSVGCGACATTCGPCGASHLERLKAWACYRSTSGKICADCCCDGQRWVPIYLFFLTPPCREGCGPVCGAACGSCAAPCGSACKATPASTVTQCKAVSPAPSASPSAKPACDKPCGLVTPKAKDGCTGSCGPVSGACGSSWFLADFAHRMLSPPAGFNGH